MAPPKRTTSGRVTPKGTKPGETRSSASIDTGSANSATSKLGGRSSSRQSDHVDASSRYTPPVSPEMYESPRWVPILMAVLIGLGVLVILLRYFIWPSSNWPVVAGLAFLLGGLYTATKWH